MINVTKAEDSKILQEDINRLNEWSEIWKLRFHLQKCKILDLGRRERINYDYKLGNTNLEHSQLEKDIGVMIDPKLNFREHMNMKINKGNTIVGIIRRSFAYLTKEIVAKLVKALVHPHLEYGHAVWKPNKKADMESIERVQSRATALVPELKGKSAVERLFELKLPCMAYRTLRGDMIETYKIMNGKYDSETEVWDIVKKHQKHEERGATV